MSLVSTTDGWLRDAKQGGGTSQERMHLSNLNQTQNQDRFGKIRWHHHWKRHYWRRHLKNPHLQERTEVLDQWTSTTTKGKIMKQPQVGIREDACLSLAKGKHGTQDGHPPATTAITKIKIGRLCSSTSTSGHLVEQPWQQLSCGRRHSPCIQISISFLLLFLVCFIYIRKKMNN